MNQQQPSRKQALQAKSGFFLGLASAVLGIVNYFFPVAVTVLSIIGFAAGAAGLVLAILVRKQLPDRPPLWASAALVMGIVGLLWNLVFFMACSDLACGGTNIF